MAIDKDLLMIQEVRDLVRAANEAQKVLGKMSQDQIDRIVKAMCDEGAKASEKLARLAVDETDIGKYEDKILKNLFATKRLWTEICDMKTAGVIKEDKANRIWEIAEPMGVTGAVTPTTNPTSTAMNNAIISIKARNAIVLSPHPRAKKCTFEALEVVRKAAIAAGAPEGCIGCIKDPSIAATQELMANDGVDMIIATGGPGIVKAAYSSGKPAFGVGAGNGPAYIDRTANVTEAVKKIVASKSFDNSTICASEQSIICETENAEEIRKQFKANGGYFMNEEERLKLEKILLNEKNGMMASSVGKSAVRLAEMAGISVPPCTKVLIGDVDGVGKGYPLSYEKLSPVLAFYQVENSEQACELALKLLVLGGLGHTMSMHSNDPDRVMEFALKKPAMRILVNTTSSLGGVGGTTGLFPALTLGCGTPGGNIISDNLNPANLVNIKRLAYGTKTITDLKESLLEGMSFSSGSSSNRPAEVSSTCSSVSSSNDADLVSMIVKEVVKKLSV